MYLTTSCGQSKIKSYPCIYTTNNYSYSSFAINRNTLKIIVTQLDRILSCVSRSEKLAYDNTAKDMFYIIITCGLRS